MSPGEILLLLAVFVLLPLLQQWLASSRKREERPEQVQSPVVQPELPPPPPAPPPAAPPPLAAPTQPPERVAGPGLRDPLALRRALVLATILGPCRAIDPDNREA